MPALQAHGFSFEKLMMPGELIEGHAKYENDCKNCHASFSKQQQSRLCLDCHKKVDQDIRNREGLHGKSDSIRKQECKNCHTDHKGRGADIVRLKPQSFDHGRTDFALHGAHRALTCLSCHKTGEAYRDAPHACIACHKKDDRHNGNLGKKCDQCHQEERWKSIRYDHSRTDFPLRGKHEKVVCRECHINERYKDTPKQCISCHAINDVHQGKFGRKCESCHSADGWKKKPFDHDRKTKFPLRGRHAKVSCGDCHKQDPYTHKTDMDCVSCHKRDDIHRNVFGNRCQECHNEEAWNKTRFNHDRDTKFRLREKHRSVDCHSCHKQSVAQVRVTRICIDCHQVDDVHKGQQGKACESCHNESGWRQNLVFDHGVTRFPLLGLHALVPCEACHLGNTFKDVKTDCYSCHQSDDVHKGSMDTQCETCHNQNDWKLWQFDHNRQTDYPLEGAHRDLRCASCHQESERGKKPVQECYGCHANDDRHNGHFGTRCEQCHTTSDFREISIRR